MDDALAYVKVVEDVVGKNSEEYSAFVKIVKDIMAERIDPAGVVAPRLDELFEAYPNLLLGFNKFLPRDYEFVLLEYEEDQYMKKIKTLFQGDVRVYNSFVDIILMCKTGNKSISQVYQEVAALFKDHKGLVEEFAAVFGDYQDLVKEFPKGIHKLDLSSSESCTPSYRLLPKNYPIPSVSGRTPIDAEVLNDHCALSVRSKSDSFKHRRINKYEKKLFDCEDRRFELDISLESSYAASKRVEELLGKINNNTVKTDSPINLEEHFTALNLKCIKSLYDEPGLHVLDSLRKNAPLALPLISADLKQKQEELVTRLSDLKDVWAEIYAKNHLRSLDHRSVSFKQQDAKNLSRKALVAEITEISKKKRKGDDTLLAVAVGNKQTSAPDLVFDFADPSIHEDLYQLIKYFCANLFLRDQADEVMEIWSTFLEPMLGVPSRPQNAEDNEDSIKTSKNQAGKRSIVAVGQSSEGASNSNPSEMTNASKKRMLSRERLAKCQNLSVTGDNGEVEDGSNIADHGSLRSSPSAKSQSSGLTDEKSGASKSSSSNSGLSTIPCRPTNAASEATMVDMRSSNQALLSSDGTDVTRANPSANGGMRAGNRGHRSSLRQEKYSHHEDNKADSEGVANAHDDEVEGPTARPLGKQIAPPPLTDKDSDSRIFYGNDSFYVLFRLHQKLYERIQWAKIHSSSSERKWKPSSDASPTDSYPSFKTALCNFLDGSSTKVRFEEECLAIIGPQSYMLFTLDKLIEKLVKQLQAVATNEMDSKLLQFYADERSREHGNFLDTAYRGNACLLLGDKNIYRIECTTSPFRLISNAFLPEGFKIDLPEEPPQERPVESEEAVALNLVNKIKTRFQGDDRVYKSFVDILKRHRDENSPIGRATGRFLHCLETIPTCMKKSLAFYRL